MFDPDRVCYLTFSKTRITVYLKNNCKLEVDQHITEYVDASTTTLYDRHRELMGEKEEIGIRIVYGKKLLEQYRGCYVRVESQKFRYRCSRS